MGTIVELTGHGDKKYIVATLSQKRELIPLLASCLRDGVIQRALSRQVGGGGAKTWPPTCHHQKQGGIKYLKRVTSTWEANLYGELDAEIDEEGTDAPTIKHHVALRFLTFGTGSKPSTWVPHSNIEDIIDTCNVQYELLGKRLTGVRWTTTWQTQGYFGRCPRRANVINCWWTPRARSVR